MMSYKKIDMQTTVAKAIKDMTYSRDLWRVSSGVSKAYYMAYYEGAVFALEMLAKRAKDDAQVYRNLFGEEVPRPSEMPEDL